MDYDALFNSICSIIEEGHLENVGDLEQCLLTNEKYDSKTLNISFLQDLEATFHHFAFNDVLRLLLLGLLRFPNSHLPKLFQDFAGEVGVDALVGLRHLTRNIDISPNSTPVRKKYELTSKQEYLSRYEPSIKNILTDYIINNSSSVKSIDDILNHTTSHTSNSSIKPLRHFKPSWATLDPSSAIIDSSKEKKVIIFVLGGISVSEIQAIHESAKELDRSILIGSTELLTPTTFLNELCLLGVSRPQPLPLPTIQSCIEKEQDQLYRQQLLESQKRLQEEFAANKELEKLALVRRNTILQRINDRPPKHAPPNGYGKILGKLDRYAVNPLDRRTDLKRNLSTFSRKRTVLDDTKSEVLDHKKSVPRIPKKSEVPRLPLFDDDTFSTLSESIENVLHVEVSRWGQNQLYSTCSLDRSKVGQPDSMIKPITDTVDKSVSQMDVIHSTEETKETVEKSELTRQPHTYRIKRRSKVKLAAVEAFKSQLSNHPASGVIPDRVSSCWANKIGSCFQFKKTD
ncbi:vacuolar sorting protein VPS33/slp1 [Globomyces sp. JEL0801]|nr:vacuolar sorting protein VPS33/slp1 [Globomyces sp. JEL0801]